MVGRFQPTRKLIDERLSSLPPVQRRIVTDLFEDILAQFEAAVHVTAIRRFNTAGVAAKTLHFRQNKA